MVTLLLRLPLVLLPLRPQMMIVMPLMMTMIAILLIILTQRPRLQVMMLTSVVVAVVDDAPPPLSDHCSAYAHVWDECHRCRQQVSIAPFFGS